MKMEKVLLTNLGRDTYILNDNGGFNRKNMKIFANNSITRLSNFIPNKHEMRKNIDS